MERLHESVKKGCFRLACVNRCASFRLRENGVLRRYLTHRFRSFNSSRTHCEHINPLPDPCIVNTEATRFYPKMFQQYIAVITRHLVSRLGDF